MALAKLLGTCEGQESSSITISDDLSHSAQVEERQFLALRTSKEIPPPSLPFFSTSHEVQDYQMKQMLLEQQNKKMLMMERERLSRAQTSAHVNDTAPDPEVSTEINARFTLTDDQCHSHKRSLIQSRSDPQLDNDVLELDLVELQSYINRLEQRAKDLGGPVSEPQQAYTYRTLYRILEYKSMPSSSTREATFQRVLSPPFFDPPEWIGSGSKGTLRSHVPVENFDLFLEKNKDISFIVYKTYVAPEPTHQDTLLPTNNIPDIKINESIEPITKDLVKVIRVFLKSKDEYADLWQLFKRTGELHAPYLFVYHQRSDWDKFRATVTQPSKEQLTMLWNHIIQNHGDEYAAADACISSGKITSKYVQYLFKPRDILIERKGDFYLGWLSTSRARHIDTYKTTRGEATNSNTRGFKVPLYGTEEASKRMATEKLSVQDWEISVWQWEFDGNFQRRHDNMTFSIAEESVSVATGEQQTRKPEGIPIRDLRVFPIQHAPQDIVQKLRRRGQTFWKCRVRSFVSYDECTKDGEESMVDERYMIDMNAYRSLHKKNQQDYAMHTAGLADELGPEAMKKEEPPDDKFELLLPATIKGFNMRRKKWYDLIADRIGDVEWNKEAFQKVVMNRKAKDLIQALVSNQLVAEASTLSTDLIEGKGNGLILLLHGSPGTGKTLTAESVAEMAEKPLYRVTCGDIGTKAEDAEKYLESVLYLGKLWRCVVLLDEADVFLEQRSLEDLERNALVSVFLRVLEYYEGILILTSNRVGTFDEAFKSRIQLALHYPTLGPFQRQQIWQNFIERLEGLKEESIDVDDLRDHIEDLKDEEMNGRQIRNTITTARQYAKWKGETLTYAKLKDVIEVAGRFDKYLVKLHKGLTQDQLAEDDGIRMG
ncbi:hypothetical protein F5Y19DRAFT_473352 [Xylariaceae sp. FL1651]|nr:hypothetical protein F5Y19DRAFT_473352 [Xylariaceae sp. FL1651]